MLVLQGAVVCEPVTADATVITPRPKKKAQAIDVDWMEIQVCTRLLSWSCLELMDVHDAYLAPWSLAVLRGAECSLAKVW